MVGSTSILLVIRGFLFVRVYMVENSMVSSYLVIEQSELFVALSVISIRGFVSIDMIINCKERKY